MKILIVKTSSLGDILHAYPVIDYLKEKYPECSIDWVVEERCAELVERHPKVNQVYKINSRMWRRGRGLLNLISNFKHLRKTRYDILFDLQGNIKSGLITFFAKANKKVGFNYQTAPEKPSILATDVGFDPPEGHNIREDLLWIVKSFCCDMVPYHEKPVVLKLTCAESVLFEELKIIPQATLVCPGAFWPNKRLSELDLVEWLKTQTGPFYYAFGTEEEKRTCEFLMDSIGGTLLPKLSLPLLQKVMGQMRLVVAMDSLPLHLAATTPCQTFSFFGSTLARKYKPMGERHSYWQGTCPYGKVFEKRCPILRTCKTGSCMKLKGSVS